MVFWKRLFPFLGWFEGFKGATLRADGVAGLTVALVLIPQSMAYAQLAGLPAYYGLYAAFLPPMIASLFGSSHQLATGPVAVVSLMTAATLEPLATAGGPEFVAYAVLLALLVGVFQFTLGVLRLGLIVNFLSHPVVNGFTNAAALIIASSQLSKVFGVTVDKADHHYETIYRVVAAAFDFTHWPTLGMAALAFAIMIGLKKLMPRVPNVLVAVVITTGLSWAVGFEHNEKVGLAQIEFQPARDLIERFNQVVALRSEMERLRTTANRAFDQEQGAEHEDACTSCHTGRDLTRDAAGLIQMTSGHALALHHQAGLIDLEIKQIKHTIEDLHLELRALKFEGVQGPDGTWRFFQLGAVPAGLSSKGDAWRIKVGNDLLRPEALTMMGAGAVVGAIPEGLPAFALPHLDWSVIPRLFLMAMVISLLGFMEAISIAKAMAARTGQRLDPNQELIGQGLANMIGCLGQSYPVSGSFSRSAVNLQAGARTGMSNVASSAVVVIVLMFFTPLLYHLPQAVLAAIIMMAVVGLLNVGGFIHAWKAQRFDGIVGMASFFGTLVFAPHLEWGIAIGVLLSLGAYLYRTMKPRVAELSLHADGSLRDVERHGLQKCKHLAIIRFDGPLNFANTSYLEEEVLKTIAELRELKHVLFAAHGINEVDASGEEMIDGLVRRLRESGYQVSFSGLKEQVLDVFRRTLLLEKIGVENVYSTQLVAVANIYDHAHRGTSEPDCPLLSVRPHVVDLSLHSDGSLREAQRHGLRLCERIAALRVDGPLNQAVVSNLARKVSQRRADNPKLRCVLLAAHGVTSTAPAGLTGLSRLAEGLLGQGILLAFSGLKEQVHEAIHAQALAEWIGEEHFYPTQIQAVGDLWAKAHVDGLELDCPFEPLAPHVVDLALHPDGSLRDANRHGLASCSHIAAVRFDGVLDRASSRLLAAHVERRCQSMPQCRAVFIAAHGINRIGVHGQEMFEQLVQSLRDRGYRVAFSGLKDKVLDELHKTHLLDIIGQQNIFATQMAAIEALYPQAHRGSEEGACPLRQVVRRSQQSDGGGSA
jgi:MFS superfamily sulfate permease-like transporter